MTQKELLEDLQKQLKAVIDERDHYRSVVNGLKGRCKQFAEQIKRIEQESNQNFAAILENNDIIKRQKKIIEDLQADLFTTKTNYEYYKALPWYKKIFVK